MQTTDIVVLVGVAIFVGIFLRLMAANKSVPEHLRPPQFVPVEPEAPASILPAVGHEIGLPFDEAEVAAEVGAGEDRPEILNYFFKQTSLESGPPDVDEFVDEITIAMHTQADLMKWTSTYVIATPGGLKQLIEEKHYKYIYGDDMIIVPRYNLEVILRAVLEREFAAYSEDPGGNALRDDHAQT